MFYRASVVGVVAFWLVMMALLARVELTSGEASGVPVPPEYVWKLMFLHEQPSDLVLYTNRQRSGNVHLQPRRLPAGADGRDVPLRLLTGSGSLTLNLPGMGTQNIVLRGSLEIDDHNVAQRFEINSGFHESRPNAPRFNVILEGEPPRDQWHYQLRSGDVIWKENTGTSAILLDALNLNALGIDPKAIAQIEQHQAAATVVSARRGVLHINTEDLEAYVVTIHHGETLDSTVYVSQLGQILAVKAFGGYDLYDEALAP